MATRVQAHKLAFNRGLVSRLGIARSDINRLALAAQTQTNWMSRVLGSMMLRPGWGYIGGIYNNAETRVIPFVFSIESKAIIELTSAIMRVWVEDTPLARTAVSTTITNGQFASDVASWTDQDESGATSDHNGTHARFVGNGTAYAIREQSFTVASADNGVEHGLRVVVARGTILVRIGTSSLADDVLEEVALEEGTHSLAFTPATGTNYVSMRSNAKTQVLVDTCDIETTSNYLGTGGVVQIASPYTTSAQLRGIRHEQSGDVVFLACAGTQQYKIERRTATSWSMVKYLANDGPFFVLNTGTITITPSALSGNITLTASKSLFRSTHVGALFAITSNGQNREVEVTAENTFSDTILITGVDAQRAFSITRSGIAGGTVVTLQRSFTSDNGPWENVTTYSADGTVNYDDGLDNAIVWYRIGVDTGDFGSGTTTITMQTAVGSIRGIARITAFSSATSVSAEVLVEMGATNAQDQWQEGEWSDFRGWPSAVEIAESRLGWSGKGGTWWSVTDAYYSFDDETLGDSGPISRTIGSGPIDSINWMMTLDQILLGAQTTEWTCKSTSFGEPITPTNYQVRRVSGQGSANVNPLKIDATGLMVARGGQKVYELRPGGDTAAGYEAIHVSALVPTIGAPGIVRTAWQRQPDTRAHFVRSDGTVALCVFDSVENVICWLEITTDGEIEDVVVLPGDDATAEDQVYYVVKRTINGAAKRYMERWALESECVGGTLNKQADSFITYTQSASDQIAGLWHLEGEEVVVWDNGKCLRTAAGEIATFTVRSGYITVTNAGVAYEATNGIVGLGYTAQYKSAKFVELYGRQDLGLSARSQISSLGLILADTHHRGLKFGPAFDYMDPLPEIENGAPVAEDTVHVDYAEESIDFPGDISNDTRLCLQAQAPRPAAVLAAIAEIEAYK